MGSSACSHTASNGISADSDASFTSVMGKLDNLKKLAMNSGKALVEMESFLEGNLSAMPKEVHII